MRGGRRLDATSLLVVVVLLSLFAIGPAATASDGFGSERRSADQRAEPVLTVSPAPGGTAELWPYTSRQKSFDSATLPINMVVLADPTLVRAVLMVGPDATWENQTRGLNGSGTAEEGADAELSRVSVNETGIRWDEASGSARYTYARDGPSGEGEWLLDSYQLHDGDYFGSRYHVRFYGVPDGDRTWTALQVHREHWDWFRLRHTVGSLPQAQHYVETEFYDRWYVVDIQRVRFTRGGILNSDGWATVVEFEAPINSRLSPLPATLLVGFALASRVKTWLPVARRQRVREFVVRPPVGVRLAFLSIALFALPLLVRFGGLAVEGAELVNSPKVVAVTFYPVLALGVPLSAYVLASGLDREEGFVGAAAGFGAGLLVDYATLGITMLPIATVVHRVVLLVAVGLIAAGGADRDAATPTGRRTLYAGAVIWFTGLLWALFLM